MNTTRRFFLSRRDAFVLLAAVAFVAAASVAAFLFVDNRAEAILSARQAAVVDSELRYLQVIDLEEGLPALVRVVARRSSVPSDDLPLHALVDRDGKFLAGDIDWPSSIIADGQWRPIETNKRDTGEAIAGFGRAVLLPDGARVLIGRDRTAQSALRSALSQAILAALAVLLAVAASLVVLVNRRMLTRVDAIVGTARRIIAGNLHDRIPTGGVQDEFERLGLVLNEMLSRNEAHIEQMRIVTDAIAHDLRLPLQRVKADLERIQRDDSAAAREQALARAEGEIDEALATFRPERHNKVKVLLFFDIGGSMDDHIKLCEEMFSAAKSEFKHMEYFYFHNCLYDYVWKDNRRRHSERTPTTDIMHKYGHDYKLIFVGDATMSPYEILQPGGSIEYANEEAGAVWLRRMLDVYPKAIWLNPEPEQLWPYRQSIAVIREIMESRMYPITIEGLERAMRYLSK